VSISAQNCNETFPLHYAIYCKNYLIAEYILSKLIEYKINLNSMIDDNSGISAYDIQIIISKKNSSQSRILNYNKFVQQEPHTLLLLKRK